jgi:hypothetical protein
MRYGATKRVFEYRATEHGPIFEVPDGNMAGAIGFSEGGGVTMVAVLEFLVANAKRAMGRGDDRSSRDRDVALLGRGLTELGG